jgi:CBS domain-containing protein
MNARDLMTQNPECCTRDDTAREVARMMRDCDCGALPVVDSHDSKKVVGIVTDRDLAVRGLAEGKGPDTPVGEMMTENVQCVQPDDRHERIEEIMGRNQIRRIPVCENDRIMGMIAQADLTRHERELNDHEVRQTIERISEPAGAAR